MLLDALEALAAHGPALIVAGAQAVYLRGGDRQLGVAPYTTDADLVLDPGLLGDDPRLEEAMEGADFELLTVAGGHVEPGIWVATSEVAGAEVTIPVDLIVPEGASSGGGRRGARLGAHGKRAARRARGLEAALVDHSPHTVAALDPADGRSLQVEVAGYAALLVAKAHKLHDRLESERSDRIDDKDAADVLRLMQASRPAQVGATFSMLARDPIAGEASTEALAHLKLLFGRPGGQGVVMATRALSAAVPADRVEAVCVAYTEALLTAGNER